MLAFMYEFWEWLQSWPAPVWATIGGSTMTLLGVFFSDWRNTRRLGIQNTFAASQSELARTMAIRKEVYLTASGAFAKMQAHLLSLPTVEGDIQMEPVNEFAELIGKISMIGDTETVLLAQKFSTECSEAQVALTLLAADVKRARSDAKMYEEYRTKALAQTERVGSEIAKFLEAGSVDELQFRALQRSQDRFQEETQSYWAKELEAMREFSRRLNNYYEKAMGLLVPMGDTSVDLLIAIRHELGQSTNATKLRETFTANRERMFQQLRNVIQAVDEAREADEEASRRTG